MILLYFASVSVLQYCCASDTISGSETLQDPNFLVSSGGTFKLGFFSPENTSNRYVGIMYNVPKPSVVWVANRDKPLNDSSGFLTVSVDGNLVILNGKRRVMWSSGITNPAPNSTAQLLEDGNLVLRDSSIGRSVWESFQIPSDTFLKGMQLGGSENLSIPITAWRSPSDPSIGNFTSAVDPQRIPETFLWNNGVLYWRSGPWNGNVFIGLPDMNPVYGARMNMAPDYAGATYFYYEDTNNTRLLHFKISYTGVYQTFVINDNGGWDVTNTVARSECEVYGTCGPNAICNPKGLPICLCLQGFEPRYVEKWTQGSWNGGCVRKTLFQCNPNISVGKEGEQDHYLKLTNVKVPDMYYIVPAAEVDCGNECSKNCSCSAYTYVVGIGCMHWADNMIDVQQFSKRGSDLYLRVAHSEDNGWSNKRKKAVVLSALTIGFVLLAISLFIFWKWWNMRQGKVYKTGFILDQSSEKSKLEDLKLFTYHTLANARDHFNDKNKLGQGGFGPVYKISAGEALKWCLEIAVKRLSNSSSQGMKEFMNEVTLISKLQHCNLVRLLGSCVERGEKLLVYEFLPNKSLDTYIYGNQDSLDWNRRRIIIDGIVRGLMYLHRDSRLRIIHRDLKASNILLDEDLNPKISDFGLARIFGGKQDQANTKRVVGTYGYMAPEYAYGGKFSEKSDVYSFGVLLLELVSGKRNTSFYLDDENLSLLGYAWRLWNENEAVNLAFTEQVDPIVEMEIRRCVQVGLLCVQDNPRDRPNMSNVLTMLSSEMVDLPLPKLPVYTSTFMLSENNCNSHIRPSINGVSLTEVQGR